MNEIREGENKFKDFVANAVAPHLFRLSNLNHGVVLSNTEEDTRLSFDMKVGRYAHVSVRIRNNQYLYYRDFSIRSRTRYSGQVVNNETVKCEIDKLRDGLGCCYFYGWLDEKGEDIIDYIIVDIDPFRNHLDEHTAEKPNGDGTWARYYPISLLKRCGALIFDADRRLQPTRSRYGIKI